MCSENHQQWRKIQNCYVQAGDNLRCQQKCILVFCSNSRRKKPSKYLTRPHFAQAVKYPVAPKLQSSLSIKPDCTWQKLKKSHRKAGA